MISIITVCHNAGATIERTIKSVAMQDYDDVEYIIVDGGSNDGTRDIIEWHLDVIDQYLSEPDNGIYDAMNKGLELASGDYIAFLNADDKYAHRGVLSSVDDVIKRTLAPCVIGSLVIVDPRRGEHIVRFCRGSGFKKWMFRFAHMPPHPATFIQRKQLLEIDGFNSSYKISGDFDLLLRLFQLEGFYYEALDDTLVVMANGGVGNRGIQAKVLQNREMLNSLRVNGIYSNQALVWSKYIFKITQLFIKPRSLTYKFQEEIE